MRSYLIRPRLVPAEKTPAGLYQFKDTADAVEQLRRDASDPVRRWDLEQRQRHILEPCSDIFTRTHEGDVQDPCYAHVWFEPWSAGALQERANTSNKRAFRREIPRSQPSHYSVPSRSPLAPRVPTQGRQQT